MLFIAVDTPQGEGGSVDLSNVATVARGIGRPSTDAGFPRGSTCSMAAATDPPEQSQIDHVQPREGDYQRGGDQGEGEKTPQALAGEQEEDRERGGERHQRRARAGSRAGSRPCRRPHCAVGA